MPPFAFSMSLSYIEANLFPKCRDDMGEEVRRALNSTADNDKAIQPLHLIRTEILQGATS